MTELERALRELRARDRKALVAYVVGGLDDHWLDAIRAAVHAGCDVIEVGVPFSDPVMDGPVIQAGALRSLERGTTLQSVLDDLSHLDCEVPLVMMTYYNLVHHRGLDRSAADARAAGLLGSIIPDLPLEECGDWRTASNAAGLACVLMVAPSSPEERVARVAASSQGFVYAAARMAVTGASQDDGDASRVVAAIRRHVDTPTYVGIGITTPDQAARAASFSDGVIVGTAVVQRLLDGEGPAGVEAFLASLRRAIS